MIAPQFPRLVTETGFQSSYFFVKCLIYVPYTHSAVEMEMDNALHQSIGELKTVPRRNIAEKHFKAIQGCHGYSELRHLLLER
jgi:hypothetical protein